MRIAQFMILGNALIATAIGLYFFLIPTVMGIYYIADPQLKGTQIPRLAIDLHHALTPQLEQWAKDRVQNKRGRTVEEYDTSGHEWPLLSALYYLWATESLQAAYQKNPAAYPAEPRRYAQSAVEAAIRLLTDPKHAKWVKKHWGAKAYLQTENVHYRAMLIAGMNSYQKLTGNPRYAEALETQSLALATEFATSEQGLLRDTPKTCSPANVAFAYWAIQEAMHTLQLSADSLLENSQRGLVQLAASDTTLLPPSSVSLEVTSPTRHLARGSSTAWLLHFAPALWATPSQVWMEQFETHFWQEKWTAVGFREHAFHTQRQTYDWGLDLRAGPLLAGYGANASVFGIGACRVLGRPEKAYALSTELIALSLPHTDGRLLLPQALSSWRHAPLMGESVVLYNLTRLPQKPLSSVSAFHPPLFAYLALGLSGLLGLLILWRGIRRIRRGKQLTHPPIYLIAQLGLWGSLLCCAGVLAYHEYYLSAFALVVFSRIFPIFNTEKK